MVMAASPGRVFLYLAIGFASIGAFVFVLTYFYQKVDKIVTKAFAIVQANEVKKPFLSAAERLLLIDVKAGVLMKFIAEEAKNKIASLPLSLIIKEDKIYLFPAMFPSVYAENFVQGKPYYHPQGQRMNSYNTSLSPLEYKSIDFANIQPYFIPIADILYYTCDGGKYHISKITTDRRDETKIVMTSDVKYRDYGYIYGGVDGHDASIQNVEYKSVVYFKKDNRLENIVIRDDSYQTLQRLIPQKDILAQLYIEKPRY